MPIPWAFQYQRQFRWLRETRNHLYRTISLAGKKAVLEPGCSIALISEEIARRVSGLVVGLDTDLPALHEAKQRVPQLDLVCGDIYSPPFKREVFDCIIFQFFLLWLGQPEKALGAMTEILQYEGTVTAIAEPDYGGRIDFPEEIDYATCIADKLRDEGADPFVGRKLEYLFLRASLRNIQWGLASIPFGVERAKENFAMAWQFIAELAPPVPAKRLEALKAREADLINQGKRSYFMPVFFCTGEKPKKY
jgi:ubiquinone/menaquinone biosynthesis C-methylase UbiE